MYNYHNLIKEKTNIIVETVLEIGSRDGNDANTLKSLFNVKNSDVWVVEPNPIKINEIKEKYPLFNLCEFAISSNDGESTFYQVIGDNMSSGTSSLIDRADDWYKNNTTNKITVKTITGKNLLGIINKKINACKIDVEGLTYEVLESFGNNLVDIESIHIECEHKEVWKNQKLYDDVSNFLKTNGFVELFFGYTSSHKLQSDSIWVLKNLVKK